jgi:hypothetical protein
MRVVIMAFAAQKPEICALMSGWSDAKAMITNSEGDERRVSPIPLRLAW